MRRLSTKAAENGSGTWREWVQKRRHNLIHVGFSGTLVMISMQLVNTKHRAEDIQADLNERLQAAVIVQQMLLKRAPSLAVDAGLPHAATGKFEASLQALVTEVAADPAAALTSTQVIRTAAAPAVSGAKKQQAVW
jgi:hypothetical protein